MKSFPPSPRAAIPQARGGNSTPDSWANCVRSGVGSLEWTKSQAIRRLQWGIFSREFSAAQAPSALYEAYPPAQAKALWDRFEFVYTPKHGSWLNVAEVELNVMIRQCLNRRIDCIEVLRREVGAWQASRDRIHANVNWQFTTDDARVKLKRLYPTLDD